MSMVTSINESEKTLVGYNIILEQNYPNPFNPTTSIKYTIPDASTKIMSTQNVVIRVYDVIGNEITVLLNEVKSPGNYEIKFDGSKLSSGIYYYQIVAGDFQETKKMILLK